MKTLSLKINDLIVDQLDFLVKKGKFRSRNEAMRFMIKEGIAREISLISLFENDSNQLKSVLEHLKKEKISFEITSEKTAVELVNEGRER